MANLTPSSASVGQLVWYITGTSSGLGKRLVPILLDRGDKVIATARSLHKIQEFPKTENIRLQQLDVTDGAAVVKRKVDEAVTWFGRIDVVVNNAGIGHKAFVEEGGSQQLRLQYDVNLFGLLDVTTAVLPHMRERRSGTVVLIGSRSSWYPDNLTSGPYSSSKAAVRVLGETLSVELAEFDIRVLIVEPGAFRTEKILSEPLYAGNKFEDYDEKREFARKRFEEVSGQQPGDPVKAMKVLADVVRGEGCATGKAWPLYLPLGLEAEEAIKRKVKIMNGVLEDWGEIIRDTRLDNP